VERTLYHALHTRLAEQTSRDGGRQRNIRLSSSDVDRTSGVEEAVVQLELVGSASEAFASTAVLRAFISASSSPKFMAIKFRNFLIV
jgi:hypothetical protein